MIAHYTWYLGELLKKVWVRVAGFAVLALLSAGLARVLSPYLPAEIALQTGSQAVAQLLGILTSSMLAVTTFSLSIAVFAFATAAGTATPRATVLLQEDPTTQNVLATFLGAFLFGLVGLIALHADFYDASGRVVVFLFTVAVIGLVVVALISWIDHLMQFGRMGDTLDRVERAATGALCKRLEDPYLGGQPLVDAVPEPCVPIASTRTGYVQHIDMQMLHNGADQLGARIFLHRLPGSFVAPGEALLYVEAASVEDQQATAMCRAFTIGTRRTFQDDPRFGLIVMTEIALRALSPAVNDPGTAIDILGRFVRILVQWRERTDAVVRFQGVFVPPVRVQDAIEDAFRPIARAAASQSEVQIRLQKALASLRHSAPEVFSVSCEHMSLEALARAEAASLLPAEMRAIRSAASLTSRSEHGAEGAAAPPERTPDAPGADI